MQVSAIKMRKASCRTRKCKVGSRTIVAVFFLRVLAQAWTMTHSVGSEVCRLASKLVASHVVRGGSHFDHMTIKRSQDREIIVMMSWNACRQLRENRTEKRSAQGGRLASSLLLFGPPVFLVLWASKISFSWESSFGAPNRYVFFSPNSGFLLMIFCD